MKNDDLGDRMKMYERSSETRFRPDRPVCVRVDGRGFSRYTRGFQKPYDEGISTAMKAAARALVKETNARIGYVQSDEITLILLTAPGQTPFFDGRAQKLCSVLASIAAVTFDRSLNAVRPPAFDARVWQVPDLNTAAEVVLWRCLDARRNGVSSAYRAHFSAKQMKGKTRKQMIKDMQERGVEYERDYAHEDRMGTFFQRVTRERRIPDDVWSAIPVRSRPETRVVQRADIEQIDMPFFGDVRNKVEVIFNSAPPRIQDMTHA